MDDVRQELADAMSSIDGIDCSPFWRTVNKTGSACVKFGRADASDNGFGMVTTWDVWVVLPNDMTQAEQWIDDHQDQIVNALKRVYNGGVQSLTPVASAAGNSTINVLVVSGRR